jgi:surfeit locus 1 family protein
MLQKLRAAGLTGPTLAMLAGVALLMNLGQWQWSRKGWKEGLIAAQTARAKAEPMPLAEALVEASQATSLAGEFANLNYRRVRLTGTFDHTGEKHLYTPLNSGPGWQIMTPMLVPGHPALKTQQLLVYVDRGYVPDAQKQPQTRRIRTVGEKGGFTPDNDAMGNKWFWRDIKAMWGAKLDAGQPIRLSPYYVEADSTATNPGGWPKPGMSDAIFNSLSNRHFEYALTWWALAATLVGMYLAFARSRWPAP